MSESRGRSWCRACVAAGVVEPPARLDTFATPSEQPRSEPRSPEDSESGPGLRGTGRFLQIRSFVAPSFINQKK